MISPVPRFVFNQIIRYWAAKLPEPQGRGSVTVVVTVGRVYVSPFIFQMFERFQRRASVVMMSLTFFILVSLSPALSSTSTHRHHTTTNRNSTGIMMSSSSILTSPSFYLSSSPILLSSSDVILPSSSRYYS